MKLHFISLGCPKNLVDSEVMLARLLERGCILTEDPSIAEVIVVNTCAFIEDAKKEAIDTILAMAAYKKKGSASLLVVAGCLPQRYRAKLMDLLPEVDIFIGTGEFPRIADIIWEWSGKRGLVVGPPKYIYDHKTARLHTTPKHIGYLKIAEGCFHPCSFCTIPKVRGKFRSRPMDSIVEEAESMLENGVKEITLLAQDSTAYGRDIGTDIATLLARLAGIKGEKWIRMMYAYPHGFPDGVIKAMGEHKDICRYLDIPIQHISDGVLKRMGREGTGKEIRDLIAKLRQRLPGISLRTTIIVGFPGETAADFDELLDFVSEARFDNLGVFAFSPEEGTKAASFSGKVGKKKAEGRRRELMELQREISLSNNSGFVGRRIQVIVDGATSEKNIPLQGRHEGQAFEIDGVVLISEGIAAAGDFATVEIHKAMEYDLVGRIVS